MPVCMCVCVRYKLCICVDGFVGGIHINICRYVEWILYPHTFVYVSACVCVHVCVCDVYVQLYV